MNIFKKEMSATQDAALASAETVKHMQLEQRAWVGIENISMHPPLEGQPMRLKAILKNYGRLPAEVSRMAISLHEIRNDGPIEAKLNEFENDWAEEVDTARVLAPTETNEVNVTFGIAPDGALVDGINSGGIKLFAIGRIQYTDLFAVKRTTQCCMLYEPNTRKMQAYKQHNYMT